MLRFNKKYINHLITTYLSTIIQIVLPILLLPIMVKQLGSELYGIWVLFTTLITYFGLTGFGFGTTFLKEVSKKGAYGNISKYLSTTLGFYILVSIVAFIIFIIMMFKFENFFIIDKIILNDVKIAFSILFVVFIINFYFSLFGTLLFAKGLLHIQNYFLIFSNVATTILAYSILISGYKIIMLASVNLLISLLVGVYTYYITKKKFSYEISLHYFEFKLLRAMLYPSLHYFIITASAMVILSSDNVVISSFIGVGSVAIYSIGNKLVAVSQRLLFQIVDIMIPDISKLYDEKKYEEIKKLHNKTLLVSLILGFLGYSFLWLYGLQILEFWVGKEYVIDKTIFHVFLFFGMLHAGVHVSAIFLVAMGLHKGTSYMTLADAILNIVLSIVFLKFYGLLGVALGTLLAHLLTSGWFTTWWFYKKVNMLLIKQNREIINDV